MTQERNTTQSRVKPNSAARFGVLISSPLPMTEPVTTRPGPICARMPPRRAGGSRIWRVDGSVSLVAIARLRSACGGRFSFVGTGAGRARAAPEPSGWMGSGDRAEPSCSYSYSCSYSVIVEREHEHEHELRGDTIGGDYRSEIRRLVGSGCGEDPPGG